MIPHKHEDLGLLSREKKSHIQPHGLVIPPQGKWANPGARWPAGLGKLVSLGPVRGSASNNQNALWPGMTPPTNTVN